MNINLNFRAAAYRNDLTCERFDPKCVNLLISTIVHIYSMIPMVYHYKLRFTGTTHF